MHMHVLLNQAPIRYPGAGPNLVVGLYNQSIVPGEDWSNSVVGEATAYGQVWPI